MRSRPSKNEFLAWIFFWDEALVACQWTMPLCRVKVNSLDNPDSVPPGYSTDYEDQIDAEEITRGEGMGKAVANWIEYCIDTCEATENGQICIQFQMGASDYIMNHPDDGLGDMSTARKLATLKSDNAIADVQAKVAGWAAALEAELVARNITLRPGFLLMDFEDFALPYYMLGGNAAGNANDGNLDEQISEIGSAVVLRANARAVSGGATDRTIATLAATLSSYSVNADWRSAGNEAASRELMALSFGAEDAALAEMFYNDAIDTFATSYLGGPIRCGNYRVVYCDDDDHPFYMRNGWTAPEGSRVGITPKGSFIDDFYGGVQCPVLYPELDWWDSPPESPTSNWDGGVFGDTPQDADYEITDRNIEALQSSSVYNPDLVVPWVHWPDIGNGEGGDYSNGHNYGTHREGFRFRIQRFRDAGWRRAIIWSWDPDSQAAADTDILQEDLGTVLGSRPLAASTPPRNRSASIRRAGR